MDRLAPLSLLLDVAPEVWTEVHEEIQRQLAVVEADVCHKLQGVRVNQGRTHGDGFFLFSYRTFSMPDSAIDPVVVGMTFTAAHQGITVEADVSGEQTGDWISSVPAMTVANSRDELLTAARESAQNLFQSSQAIAAALEDPSRRVE
ncbi:MAG TPA: hypothetical protein VGP68_08170 [Gemmataceae bacterium]|nr:hypothetical protein [Gemmataceae bacterium]